MLSCGLPPAQMLLFASAALRVATPQSQRGVHLRKSAQDAHRVSVQANGGRQSAPAAGAQWRVARRRRRRRTCSGRPRFLPAAAPTTPFTSIGSSARGAATAGLGAAAAAAGAWRLVGVYVFGRWWVARRRAGGSSVPRAADGAAAAGRVVVSAVYSL